MSFQTYDAMTAGRRADQPVDVLAALAGLVQFASRLRTCPPAALAFLRHADGLLRGTEAAPGVARTWAETVLFAEVSVAKALLEQIAYVSRGRPEYAAQLLENVRRYVDDDLTRLSAEPVTALLGGSSTNYADPLEQVMWLTSVGSPGDVYETVRSLREARGQRLGALQRKLPAAHFGLLAVLGVLVLAIFPLLAAALSLIHI